jgi:hypothetical protein
VFGNNTITVNNVQEDFQAGRKHIVFCQSPREELWQEITGYGLVIKSVIMKRTSIQLVVGSRKRVASIVTPLSIKNDERAIARTVLFQSKNVKCRATLRYAFSRTACKPGRGHPVKVSSSHNAAAQCIPNRSRRGDL